jgi:cysteine desulfurase/selenocysteine lyase
MNALDVGAIRRDFPALSQEVNGKPLVYLDNAATSQKPRAVLDVLDTYYLRDNANVHRGIHELSRRSTVAYEKARAKVAAWIGAPDPAEVVWTRGTTEAINLVAHAWGLDHVGDGDEILLTVMEHHSNLVPWQLLAQRTGARLRYIELDDEGRLVLDDLDSLLTPRTRLVALSHVSNALGTINPVQEIAAAARAVGARILVDGAQGAVHTSVDVQDLGVDFYAFSGHKMCGPTGIGALWARRDLLEAMTPYQGGGEMIHTVERDESTWAEVPHKFEAGTPNIAGAIGMGAAVDYLSSIGMDAITDHERKLSFIMGDAHPHDIATILDSQGIAVRAGHHCAQLVMRHFGVSATARASFYLYNTQEDVDRLVGGLRSVGAIFG